MKFTYKRLVSRYLSPPSPLTPTHAPPPPLRSLKAILSWCSFTTISKAIVRRNLVRFRLGVGCLLSGATAVYHSQTDHCKNYDCPFPNDASETKMYFLFVYSKHKTFRDRLDLKVLCSPICVQNYLHGKQTLPIAIFI